MFTRFATDASPKLVPWREHARRVVRGSGATLEATMVGSVVWHLAAANNRILARSAAVFATVADATTVAQSSVDAAAELSPVLVRDGDHGALGWFVELHGDVVATCSRWYATERDRRNALGLALDCFPVAIVLSSARASHPALTGSIAIVRIDR